MKGALGLIVIAAVIWVFWMSFEWLRNRKNK
jgi:Tfp pilus assembly protein PilW